MRAGGADYRDEARLEHMMRAVGRIKAQLDGLERAMLAEGDDRTELIIYNIQVLGEAANNVSEEMCVKHPEVDFKGWASMRHRLVHDYANIDLNIVWNAVCDDLPKLEMALKPIVDAFPKVPDAPENLGEFL
ncbi:MAG: DUF86 domain-containing protein [Kiritimatiellae bacterium]|nr:DUF86 domain-containing protein [Kiritimatiellia bacterium]